MSILWFSCRPIPLPLCLWPSSRRYCSLIVILLESPYWKIRPLLGKYDCPVSLGGQPFLSPSVPYLLVCFQTANLADANASEEDKIKAMISQSIHDYDPIQSVYTHKHTHHIIHLDTMSGTWHWWNCNALMCFSLAVTQRKLLDPHPGTTSAFAVERQGITLDNAPCRW